MKKGQHIGCKKKFVLVRLDNVFSWLNKETVEKLLFLWVFTPFQGAFLLFLVSEGKYIGSSYAIMK